MTYRLEFDSDDYVRIYRYNWLTRFIPSMWKRVAGGYYHNGYAGELINSIRKDIEFQQKKPIAGSADVVIAFLQQHVKETTI